MFPQHDSKLAKYIKCQVISIDAVWTISEATCKIFLQLHPDIYIFKADSPHLP